MKVFSLTSINDMEYAVVFAETIEEAKSKAWNRTGIPIEDWYGEEFKQGMYDDVLWFC